MTRLMISALAAVALLAGVTGILRLRSLSTNAGTAAMPAMQDLQSSAAIDELPVEEFEDRSLVYPRETKR
jgi:hypothetical protein